MTFPPGRPKARLSFGMQSAAAANPRPFLAASLSIAIAALSVAGNAVGQSQPPVTQPPLPTVQVPVPPRPQPYRPPNIGMPAPEPVRPDPNIPTLPEDGSGESCEDIKRREAPPQSDRWCGSDYTPQRRANAAVQEFVQQLAGDSQYGPQSGLGMLHEFLRHPQAQLQVPGRGSAADQITQLIGNALARGQAGGTPDWGQISGQISAACFLVEIAVTGRPINIAPQQSTETCVTAAGVLRMESQGAPFNAEYNQTWLDGISVSVGGGVSIGGDVGRLLTRLLDAAGFKDGLRTTSSLNAVNKFINDRLQACEKYLKIMEAAQCPVP
jgi:hypothetical protein